MTDGISKVVPPEAVPVRDDALNFGVVQAKDWVIPTACGVRVVDERMAYGWNECRKATIDRLESATTPAEVELPELPEPVSSVSLAAWGPKPDYYTADQVREYAATLARQLAEAKASAEFVQIGLRNRGEYIEGQPPLPLALVAYDHMKRRAEQAESQLTEATRRLGEVEGLVGEWREAANGERDYYSDALRAAAAQLEAALTKEPTK